MIPYFATTPHPYPPGPEARSVVWTERVVSPGAEFLRVHFKRLSLAPGDYLTVSSVDGSQRWTYSGREINGNSDFWSFAVDGDTAIVDLYGGRGVGHGYEIDAIGRGTSPLGRNRPPADAAVSSPRAICGSANELEDVACHAGESNFDAAQRPVARLLFVRDSRMVLCTGWLVAGSRKSMMMTNNHCISTKAEVLSLQAKFNYQYIDCMGSAEEPTTDYAGKSIVKTNDIVRGNGTGGLDYTLLLLNGNPEATWGELTPTTRTHFLGDEFWLIGHPAGTQKRVAYWEDPAHVTPCSLHFVRRTYEQSAPDSQLGYFCDTLGGSSGSPLVSPQSGRVFGLHHLGGVTDCQPSGTCYTCVNAATRMDLICQDAGNLLRCEAD